MGDDADPAADARNSQFARRPIEVADDRMGALTASGHDFIRLQQGSHGDGNAPR